MSGIKLKKKSWLRRRFIRSEALLSLTDWSDSYEELKQQILTNSAFQLVGHKRVIAVDSKSKSGYVLIEVVGIPKPGFLSFDMEAQEVLVFDCRESIFDVDFLTLSLEAKAIMDVIQGPLSDTYHIVFDDNHLALHFFI